MSASELDALNPVKSRQAGRSAFEAYLTGFKIF